MQSSKTYLCTSLLRLLYSSPFKKQFPVQMQSAMQEQWYANSFILPNNNYFTQMKASCVFSSRVGTKLMLVITDIVIGIRTPMNGEMASTTSGAISVSLRI